MTVWLNQQGYGINRKRIQRLMRLMGLEGLAPGPQTSVAHPAHSRYPYLLRDVAVVRPNQAWCVMCPWPSALCTWSPLWIGLVGTWWVGPSRIPSTLTFVWTHWTRRSPMGRQIFSIVIKAFNLRLRRG